MSQGVFSCFVNRLFISFFIFSSLIKHHRVIESRQKSEGRHNTSSTYFLSPNFDTFAFGKTVAVAVAVWIQRKDKHLCLIFFFISSLEKFHFGTQSKCLYVRGFGSRKWRKRKELKRQIQSDEDVKLKQITLYALSLFLALPLTLLTSFSSTSNTKFTWIHT